MYKTKNRMRFSIVANIGKQKFGSVRGIGNAADCKSVADGIVGSSPTRPTKRLNAKCLKQEYPRIEEVRCTSGRQAGPCRIFVIWLRSSVG